MRKMFSGSASRASSKNLSGLEEERVTCCSCRIRRRVPWISQGIISMLIINHNLHKWLFFMFLYMGSITRVIYLSSSDLRGWSELKICLTTKLENINGENRTDLVCWWQGENIKYTMEQQMVFLALTVGNFTVADEITPFLAIDNFD